MAKKNRSQNFSSNNRTSNDQQKGPHSFYKEAKQSWLNEDGIDWKKIKKVSFKTLKWGLGLYLGVAALWGCVQGFIISTSPYVAKGLETYQSYDTVISNFYQVANNTTFQVSAGTQYGDDEQVDNNGNGWEAANEDIREDENGLVNQYGMMPLPFMVPNPQFGYSIFLYGEDTNCDGTEENIVKPEAIDILPTDIWIQTECDTNDQDSNDLNGDNIVTQADVDVFNTTVKNKPYIMPAEYQYLINYDVQPSYSYQVSLLDSTFTSSYLNLIQPSSTTPPASTPIIPDYNPANLPEDNGFVMSIRNSQLMATYDFVDDEFGAQPVWHYQGVPVGSHGTSNDVNIKEIDENEDGIAEHVYVKKAETAPGVEINPTNKNSDPNDLRYNPNSLVVPVDINNSAITFDQWYHSPETISVSIVPIVNADPNAHKFYDTVDQELKTNEYYVMANQAVYIINLYAFASKQTEGTITSQDIVLTYAEGENKDTEITLYDLLGQKIVDAQSSDIYVNNETERAKAINALTYVQTYSPVLEALPSTQAKFATQAAKYDVNNYYPASTLPPVSNPAVAPPEQQFGVSLIILPLAQGSQVLTPTKDAMNEANKVRNKAFDEQGGWENVKGYGDDPKTANAGWMLLGEDNTDNGVNDREIYQVYADSSGSTYTEVNGDANGDSVDDGKLVAATKSISKGGISVDNPVSGSTTANSCDSIADPNKRSFVLECKTQDMFGVNTDGLAGNESAYAKSTQSTEVEFDSAKFTFQDFYVPVIGFGSLTELGAAQTQSNSVTPNEQRGTSTKEETSYINQNGNVSKESGFTDSTGTFHENTDFQKALYFSALDYAIRESGQSDYDSVHRYAMVTWAEAWAWGGPYYGTFVYPLSQLSMWVQSWMPYETMGAWSVIIGVFLIIIMLRTIGSLMAFRKRNSQNKMNELQVQIANIKSKYPDQKTNKQSKQRMQQEIQALYKKHEVNPFQSLSTMLITMPIFLALWTIISAIPIYKVASIGAFSFAISPMQGLFNTGMVGFIYFIFILLLIFVQWISTKLPNWLADKRRGIKHLDEATKAQLKKQNRTSTIMLVVFIILGLTIPTLLGLYWVFSGVYTIFYTFLQHKNILRKERKNKIRKQTSVKA